ncbi:FtsX-like permease family protein [Clostridium felsineum]|uniref:FtsX-like permease family protein n=1 Tax=Clostridium felsineum TaxID=36839 RepID=UPI00214DAB82|nr:ABC transporter permease [Clostridium felsineum]
MKFSEIAFKMLRKEAKRYKLFILCNVVSTAILYSFISIMLNKQFMDNSIVDPMISSNIYAPTLFIFVFSLIFIPYSQNVFIRARQKDYGILLSIGMTENEVRKSVLMENFIMWMAALIIGLMAGTILSLFFLWTIHKIIGIQQINIAIPRITYGIVIVYSAVLFVISLGLNVYRMMKRTIYEKIKYAQKAEIGKFCNVIFIITGVLLTIIAIIVMYINSDIWTISFFLAFIGSLITFFNGQILIDYFQKKNYKKYLKNIFLISDIKYYYSKNKNIFFINTWLIFVILFFSTLSLVNYPIMVKYSATYHPFHMVYCDSKLNFKALNNTKVKYIVEKGNNSIKKEDSVKFLRNNAFTIFSVDDVNKSLKRNYKVKQNSFIYVHPYDINDGYEHTDIKTNITSINIKYNKGERNFSCNSTIVNPLFGQINCISQNILLVNEKDYQWIASNGMDYFSGTLHLYNFSNWRNSEIIVNRMTNELLKNNGLAAKDSFYKISSRIEAYNTGVRSSKFLIFNLIYVCFLLYCASLIMLHYKLKMEYKDEKAKYFSLYRIGIQEEEIKKVLSRKILIMYFLPLIYGAIMDVFFGQFAFNLHVLTLTVIFVFAIVHFIIYKVYFNIYYKRFILELFKKGRG